MIWFNLICLLSIVMTTIAVQEATYILNTHSGLVLEGDEDALYMEQMSNSRNQHWEFVCSFKNVKTGQVLAVSDDTTDYILMEQQDEDPKKYNHQYFKLGPNKKLFLLNGDLEVIPFYFNEESNSVPLVTEYLNESMMLPYGYNLLYEQ